MKLYYGKKSNVDFLFDFNHHEVFSWNSHGYIYSDASKNLQTNKNRCDLSEGIGETFSEVTDTVPFRRSTTSQLNLNFFVLPGCTEQSEGVHPSSSIHD